MATEQTENSQRENFKVMREKLACTYEADNFAINCS